MSGDLSLEIAHKRGLLPYGLNAKSGLDGQGD